jgi:hypothetical protein
MRTIAQSLEPSWLEFSSVCARYAKPADMDQRNAAPVSCELSVESQLLAQLASVNCRKHYLPLCDFALVTTHPFGQASTRFDRKTKLVDKNTIRMVTHALLLVRTEQPKQHLYHFTALAVTDTIPATRKQGTVCASHVNTGTSATREEFDKRSAGHRLDERVNQQPS